MKIPQSFLQSTSQKHIQVSTQSLGTLTKPRQITWCSSCCDTRYLYLQRT